MSQMKRYDWGKNDSGEWDLLEFSDGDYVKFSEYAALAAVCRELANQIDCTHVTLGSNRRLLVNKALAILGGEKGDGT